MRSLKEVCAVVFALIVLPVTAATVSALPPSGFETINPDDFTPVEVIQVAEAPLSRVDAVLSATAAPSLALIIEPHEPLPTAKPRPKVNTPEAKAQVIIKATPRPAGGGGTFVGTSGNGRLSGRASWYCNHILTGSETIWSKCPSRYPDGPGADYYAAAGPALRIAMGGGAPTTAPDPWRGKTVTVCGNGQCIGVKLIDWCQCFYRQSNEKAIDLFKDAYDVVGGNVTVSW